MSAQSTRAAGGYPARLDGRLEPVLSRWLWLVKWLLAIPHALVLCALWIAVVPLTVVAGFAILFTGRYPRAIFDFNVGVMRWTWRVTYYAYSALGTDRYPPFALRPDPTYPADFTVDYPQRLSRGLVLVKWWLLAIPHYIVVGFFADGWTVGSEYGDSVRYAAGGGLIGILVLIAAVVLLFTGRYPQSVYDFVMGMNRWCYRVLAYVALLRDEVPAVPPRQRRPRSRPPATRTAAAGPGRRRTVHKGRTVSRPRRRWVGVGCAAVPHARDPPSPAGRPRTGGPGSPASGVPPGGLS